jgi:zona occludens toxin (predicted ATPase)
VRRTLAQGTERRGVGRSHLPESGNHGPTDAAHVRGLSPGGEPMMQTNLTAQQIADRRVGILSEALRKIAHMTINEGAISSDAVRIAAVAIDKSEAVWKGETV